VQLRELGNSGKTQFDLLSKKSINMLVNLLYSMISASFVTYRHTLLAPALQMAWQIELNGNSIQIDSPTELIIPGSSNYY